MPMQLNDENGKKKWWQIFLCIQYLQYQYVYFQMFRKLHNAYVDMLCNPFYTPGENITSP